MAGGASGLPRHQYFHIDLERISQGAEDGDREIALAGLDLGQVALADAQVPGQVRLLQATVLAPGPDRVRTVDDRVHDLGGEGLFITGRRVGAQRLALLCRLDKGLVVPAGQGDRLSLARSLSHRRGPLLRSSLLLLHHLYAPPRGSISKTSITSASRSRMKEARQSLIRRRKPFSRPSRGFRFA